MIDYDNNKIQEKKFLEGYEKETSLSDVIGYYKQDEIIKKVSLLLKRVYNLCIQSCEGGTKIQIKLNAQKY